MKMNPDDPRLTAYALGELDAAERKAIEAELDNAAECRREVEEVARTAALVNAELAAEPLPGLTYAQQLAIEAKLKPVAPNAEARKGSLLSALREPNLIGRAVAFAGAVALVLVALMAASWLATYLPQEPRPTSAPIAKAPQGVESDESGMSDAAFARWAAPYQRLRIPLVPVEEAASYTPPEILPMTPAPTIRNSKS